MTYVSKPEVHHPLLKLNEIGLNRRDYEGSVSTLCAGCGHDSVSAAIVQACAELSIPPHRFLKISGIGCSSKTPSYFLGNSHGFNSVHGRMPSVATGANLANRDMYCVGVSGDGDSASIGLGQFGHIVRRKIDMLYIVDNNGTYGLTKGQFSATNDLGSTSKKGAPTLYAPIDMVSMALQIGASFVARSFSGDKRQLVPLVKAAIMHKGFAFIDVISPCVMFNNHPGSTKSYDYVREHTEHVVDADVVGPHDEITVDYEPLSAVVRVDDALAPDAIAIWEDNPGNEAFTHLVGDETAVEDAFQKVGKSHLRDPSLRGLQLDSRSSERPSWGRQTKFGKSQRVFHEDPCSNGPQ